VDIYDPFIIASAEDTMVVKIMLAGTEWAIVTV
jgi:hypothetical protein